MDNLYNELKKHFFLDISEERRKTLGTSTYKKPLVEANFTELGKTFSIMPFFREFQSGHAGLYHYHTFLEIVFVLEGEATHKIEGKKIPVSKGDIFFIGQNINHSISVKENKLIRYASFAFLPEIVDPILSMQKLDKGLSYFLIEPFFYEPSSAFKISVNDETFIRLATLAFNIIHSFNDNFPKPVDQTFDLFKAFIKILYDEYKKIIGKTEKQFSKHEKLYWTIMKEIEKKLSEKFTLEEIAKEVGTGRTKLAQLFKEHQGESVMEYAKRRRVEKAAELLRNTDMQIVEVAFESGFHDLSYFNRAFREIFNTSPSSYRKTNRQ
ncbi:MAG: helix-turn-helix domain-containing protein [Spirochaetales bacterium]|nr:helix-turn-helix domain-containing protein [Spirochaetales bacterium]